ncbi:hypothetical protein ACKE5C_10985 [Aneurinibacillus thermoaerophilus]|uniref:ATP-binding protein n=1 Tax=Aneurinibacillus thermoaerophilus TaxID=143495 RepID=A0ABX8Y7V8_ANETH|nr:MULTISPECIES: hypothetical protein [Aneurinibacillus]MED0674019.1 hypothetical protein [Aneurinibacillus thermoaerophilus]QYY41441.1 ATP-binding protein [Aneurinibacillus thermoaerophilus]
MMEKIEKYCQRLNVPTICDVWSEAAEQAAKNNVLYSAFLFSLPYT